MNGEYVFSGLCRGQISAPSGAQEVSQGREPLEPRPNNRGKPWKGDANSPAYASVAPSGAIRGAAAIRPGVR
jgi:hypothetical protein